MIKTPFFSSCRAGLRCLLMMSAAVVLPAMTVTAEADTLAETFAEPPTAFRAQPLFHLNGELTEAESRAQLKAAREDSGFGGVALLPVRETRPAYLSDDYFGQYGKMLDLCDELGLNAIFYDDIGFPSGTAGTQMREQFPQHLAGRLDRVVHEVRGPGAWESETPEGELMAVVAVNNDTLQRVVIPPPADGEPMRWQAPEGKWRVMVFTCVRSGKFVDYLDPEALDQFFELTYDAFHERFADHFGTTIWMTFFDDVGLRKEARRTWTPKFNDLYQAATGEDPASLYPALWEDIGPDTAAARVALFGFRAQLLSDGYPKKAQAWASEHGVLASGHAMGQYHPQPTFMAGDAIKFYEHTDVPMMDAIHYYGHGRTGHKLTSSAATIYDKPLTAIEIYGNYRPRTADQTFDGNPRPGFDADMLYRSGAEAFGLGANVILPHGMWYAPDKMRLPPLISQANPEVADELEAYNDWVARCSVLLRGGQHVAEVAVLYPIADMQAHAHLDAVIDQKDNPESVHPGLYVPEHSDLNMISAYLSGAVRQDFTYLHPEVLDERCSTKRRKLVLDNEVNTQSYEVLIMPGTEVIHVSNLKQIKAFYDGGGIIVATSRLPTRSAEPGQDAEVRKLIKAIFNMDPADAPTEGSPIYVPNHRRGLACFIPTLKDNPANLTRVVQAVNRYPNALFEDMPETVSDHEGLVLFLHRIKDGRQVYYFSNTTDEPIDATAQLRGDLTLEWWDPHTGEIRPADTYRVTDDQRDYTYAQVQLDPLRTVFLVESAK